MDVSLAIGGGPDVAFKPWHHMGGADQYNGPAWSAKVNFIVEGDLTNAINKSGRPGQ